MLTKMDQNTIAKMTAALEYVCKKIPPDKDSKEIMRPPKANWLGVGRLFKSD